MKRHSPRTPDVLRKSGPHRNRKRETGREFRLPVETDCSHCGGSGINTEGLCDMCQPAN